MTNLIMSYPRSGNHLIRAILEAKSGQPTLGCVGNPADVPIRDRFANTDVNFTRRSEVPIGQKLHRIYEKFEIMNAGEQPKKLLLIVRDPSRCIVSQIVRGLQSKKGIRQKYEQARLANTKRLEKRIFQDLEHWLSLIDHYTASDLPKLAISFEKITSHDRLTEVNERLLPFFNITEKFATNAELDTIGNFGRESQLHRVKSLAEGAYKKYSKQSFLIQRLVDYDKLCHDLFGLE